MATLREKKPVWVAVYVEKPRRKRLLPNTNQKHVHHHHHHHLYLHKARQQHGPKGKGHNRKTELLEYSRQLRESARSAASTPLLQHSNPESPPKQIIQKQIFPVKNKPKIVRTPTCLGDWKLLVPRFLRSSNISKKKERKGRSRTNFQTTGTRLKTIMKSFQANANKGFMSKVLASLKRHR